MNPTLPTRARMRARESFCRYTPCGARPLTSDHSAMRGPTVRLHRLFLTTATQQEGVHAEMPDDQ
jgi:hypothetical protein